jgi:hypothetical protein
LSAVIHEQVWSIVVPHHARGAHVARHRLAAALERYLPAALLADTISVVAELVGNAVRHAEALPGGVIRVAWRIGPAGEPAAPGDLSEAQVAPGNPHGGGGDGHMANADQWTADQGIFVEVRVTDGGSARTPVARVVGPDALDGRGLAIVAALARRWGAERVGSGHSVWAELGVPRRAGKARSRTTAQAGRSRTGSASPGTT